MGAHGRSTPDPARGDASGSPVVAVIEDDPSFRRALGRSLRLHGFETAVFATAEEFLRQQGPDSSDCVVLDIHLGGMNGFELQAELAMTPTAPPVILITAFDDPGTRQRAEQAGVAGYLQKPFDDKSLLDAIDKALARRPRR
jgi:FixJ family two-component response regulator